MWEIKKAIGLAGLRVCLSLRASLSELVYQKIEAPGRKKAEIVKNKRIVHLIELILTEEDQKSLGDEQLAFIATLSFAIDEIRVFQRLVLQTIPKVPEAAELKLAHGVQQLTLMRTLNAKIFEAMKILEKSKKSFEEKKYSAILSFLGRYDDRYKDLKSGKSYELARIIRNQVTNHYIPSKTQSNLNALNKREPLKMYLHDKNGSSFHPFGEMLVFIGRFFQEAGSEGDVEALIDDWRAWGLSASEFLTKLHQEYLIWLFENALNYKRPHLRTPYLEYDLVGEIGVSKLPVHLVSK